MVSNRGYEESTERDEPQERCKASPYLLFEMDDSRSRDIPVADNLHKGVFGAFLFIESRTPADIAGQVLIPSACGWRYEREFPATAER